MPVAAAVVVSFVVLGGKQITTQALDFETLLSAKAREA